MAKDDESMRTDNNSGHEAGDRAEVNRIKNTLDGDTNPGEAENTKDGAERISGKEAEDARRKATEGIRQGRDD
jgi:hypothetical protein